MNKTFLTLTLMSILASASVMQAVVSNLSVALTDVIRMPGKQYTLTYEIAGDKSPGAEGIVEFTLDILKSKFNIKNLVVRHVTGRPAWKIRGQNGNPIVSGDIIMHDAFDGPWAIEVEVTFKQRRCDSRETCWDAQLTASIIEGGSGTETITDSFPCKSGTTCS